VVTLQTRVSTGSAPRLAPRLRSQPL
jgi:hypothetical protein